MKSKFHIVGSTADKVFLVDDEVDVTGLEFNKDYIIIEYP